MKGMLTIILVNLCRVLEEAGDSYGDCFPRSAVPGCSLHKGGGDRAWCGHNIQRYTAFNIDSSGWLPFCFLHAANHSMYSPLQVTTQSL